MPPSSSDIDLRILITEETIKKALQNDKGRGALLNSWKVVNFNEKGHVGLVTSVEIKYSTSQEKDCEVTYIVKVIQKKKVQDSNDDESYVYEDEGKFYKELLPKLNEALTSAGQKSLLFPDCFLVYNDEGSEQLYFEDLRAKGFSVFDNKKSMDKHHIALVISELARLHSASYLLRMNYLDGATVSSKYDWLLKDVLMKKAFTLWSKVAIDTAAKCLETVDGYEKAIAWLKSVKPEVEYILTSYLQSEKFNCICHGDCWNDNILFRYNKGHPVEVRLVDLQLAREASGVTDLNHYLLTNVSGDVRKQNLDYFMSLYHLSYKKVLEGGDMPMHFTKEDILQEYKDKNVFGLIFALFSTPMRMLDSEDRPEKSGVDQETYMKNFLTISMEKLKTSPLFKPFFLALFDELMEAGLIC